MKLSELRMLPEKSMVTQFRSHTSRGVRDFGIQGLLDLSLGELPRFMKMSEMNISAETIQTRLTVSRLHLERFSPNEMIEFHRSDLQRELH